MSSLVVYSSKTGNTKKLAYEVFNIIKDEKKRIFAIDDLPLEEDLKYTNIFIGFWVINQKPDNIVTKFLSRVKKSNVFLFCSHASEKGSDALNYARSFLTSAEAKVIGTFSCKGKVHPNILEKLKQLEKPPSWLDEAAQASSHPSVSDLEQLKTKLLELGF